MQPCSAKYSCSYCLGTAPFEEEAELRTFESVEQDHLEVAALAQHPEVGGDGEVGDDEVEDPAPDRVV